MPESFSLTMQLKGSVSFRVLIVEHHGDLGVALWRFLQGMGHQVEVVTSLRTAQATLQKRRYDVLLTDVRLPEGLCFFLFQEGEYPPPRFIVTMSAYELEPEVRAAYPCVRRHLLKMFVAEEVEELFASFAEEMLTLENGDSSNERSLLMDKGEAESAFR